MKDNETCHCCKRHTFAAATNSQNQPLIVFFLENKNCFHPDAIRGELAERPDPFWSVPSLRLVRCKTRALPYQIHLTFPIHPPTLSLKSHHTTRSSGCCLASASKTNRKATRVWIGRRSHPKRDAKSRMGARGM